MSPFPDRRAAGRALAEALAQYASRPDVVVLALPRGGVPVGAEVARALGAPLDVFVVRKLGVPGHRELAMGAIASGGVRVLDQELISELGITEAEVAAVAAAEEQELARREAAYRVGRTRADIADRMVILVDDGLATGSTMRAAVEAVLLHGPRRIVVAVPVGAAATCRELSAVCVETPEPFHAVGAWYRDFSPTSDDEVQRLLKDVPT